MCEKHTCSQRSYNVICIGLECLIGHCMTAQVSQTK